MVRVLASVTITSGLLLAHGTAAAYTDVKAASGARLWVDPKTPGEVFAYTSSRGDQWELVMSDEFDTPGRTFKPGDDHLWTAIEAPDGVNAALEYYAAELATTECLGDTVCYLKLKVLNEPRTVSVWNANKSPPGMQDVTMFYQSAMLQSWNKFCFQGGMVEVRAKLPGGLTKNPDVAAGAAARVKTTALYPTWPGIWMMGNLGRALFTQSTQRMWPFSYDKCEPSVFDPQNQRISACNATPGSGLNANQGRGAPEIDILEGGGLEVISSLQVAPGMPTAFRRVEGESSDCVFDASCKTLGANVVGVPTETYAARGHKSWYQGLRYASNAFCAKNATQGAQTLSGIQASLAKGIAANKCDLETCPASMDVNSDLGVITGATTATTTANANWGINTDGSCFAHINTYDGALLCSAGNTDAECVKQAGGAQPAAAPDAASIFKYRLDALSANWPIHVAMYTDFLAYQVEWVPGSNGYIRWMLERQPLFEIPASALTNPPQDTGKSNPTKMMPEEPMYLIMNVALSSSWSAEPPNAGRACRDHGNTTDPDTIGLSNLVCDQFPLDMRIDYVRVYQDVSSTSTMSVGCDPASHPTKQWIADHITEYQDPSNPVVEVSGKGFCASDADCTLKGKDSGTCFENRCLCSSVAWGGPRCMEATGKTPGASNYGPATGNSGGNNNSSENKDKNASSKDSGTGLEIQLGAVAGGILVLIVIIAVVGRQYQLCLFRREGRGTTRNSRITRTPGDITDYPNESANRFAWADDDMRPTDGGASTKSATNYVLAPISESQQEPQTSFLPRITSSYKPIVMKDPISTNL